MKCVCMQYIEAIRVLVRDFPDWKPARTIYLTFVPDEEVGPLFAGTDFLVLAYERSFTSGAAALAMTMGVPVIASDIGNMREAIPPQNHALIYDPNQPGALREAIETACRMPAEQHLALQRACLDFAAARTPEKFARRLTEEIRARGLL